MEDTRPLLVFDGDCAFCTRSVRVLRRWLGRQPEIQPWQALDLDALNLTREECETAVQWIGLDGRRAAGHVAVARTLIHAGKGWGLVGRLLLVPGVSWLAARVYSWIARNRHRMPGGTAECSLPADQRVGSGGGI